MSCSMMSIDAPSSRRTSHEQGAHRLGLALGDAGGRLVEAEHAGVEGEQAGQLDDAPGAGRQLGDGLVGVAAEAEEVDQLDRLGALGALAADRAGARTAVVSSRLGPAPGLERDLDGLADGELGEQRGGLEGAAESVAGPLRRGGRRRSPRRAARPCRSSRTKPPSAFMSVVLPAPLVPMSPTISPLRTSIDTVVVGLDAAEGHAARPSPARTTSCVGRRSRSVRPMAAGDAVVDLSPTGGIRASSQW